MTLEFLVPGFRAGGFEVSSWHPLGASWVEVARPGSEQAHEDADDNDYDAGDDGCLNYNSTTAVSKISTSFTTAGGHGHASKEVAISSPPEPVPPSENVNWFCKTAGATAMG